MIRVRIKIMSWMSSLKLMQVGLNLKSRVVYGVFQEFELDSVMDQVLIV